MIFILFILFLFIFIFIPIYVDLEIKNLDIIKIKVYIFSKSIKYSFNVNTKNILDSDSKYNKKITKEMNNVKDKINSTDDNFLIDIYDRYINCYRPLVNYVVDKVSIRKFTWFTTLGLKDAALTAFCIGLLWNIKSVITSFLSSKVSTNNLSINVLPKYEEVALEIYFNCIIKFKLVYIIIAGIKAYKIKKKKGCESSVRSSN